MENKIALININHPCYGVDIYEEDENIWNKNQLGLRGQGYMPVEELRNILALHNSLSESAKRFQLLKEGPKYIPEEWIYEYPIDYREKLINDIH